MPAWRCLRSSLSRSRVSASGLVPCGERAPHPRRTGPGQSAYNEANPGPAGAARRAGQARQALTGRDKTMSKVATVLLLMVLIALTAVQIVQTWQPARRCGCCARADARSAESCRVLSQGRRCELAEAAKSAARATLRRPRKQPAMPSLFSKSPPDARDWMTSTRPQSPHRIPEADAQGRLPAEGRENTSESQPPSRH